jgi:hypothetical protein
MMDNKFTILYDPTRLDDRMGGWILFNGIEILKFDEPDWTNKINFEQIVVKLNS